MNFKGYRHSCFRQLYKTNYLIVSNSRNRFIIEINIYFNLVIIFSCEISKLSSGKI